MAHGLTTPIGEVMLQPRFNVRLRGTSLSVPTEIGCGSAVGWAAAGGAAAAGGGGGGGWGPGGGGGAAAGGGGWRGGRGGGGWGLAPRALPSAFPQARRHRRLR